MLYHHVMLKPSEEIVLGCLQVSVEDPGMSCIKSSDVKKLNGLKVWR